MSRQPNMPNAENCSLAELETAAGATVSLRSHVRIMAIKALLLGITHDQVAKLNKRLGATFAGGLIGLTQAV